MDSNLVSNMVIHYTPWTLAYNRYPTYNEGSNRPPAVSSKYLNGVAIFGSSRGSSGFSGTTTEAVPSVRLFMVRRM